jgi:phage terminase large subunit-like protein
MIEGVITLTRLNPLKGVSRLEWAYLMNEIEGLRMESQWS